MKRIIFALLLLLFSFHVKAQISPAISDSVTKKAFISPKFDYVEMKNNKIWVVDSNKRSLLTKSLTLINGTVIKRNAQVKRKDGTKYTLAEGDRLMMNGQLIKTQKLN